jgi:hypothetical protein
MRALLAAVLFLLPLSAPFGEASATATSTDGGLRLEVSVEVEGEFVAVLVRGVGSGASELPPVALADQGDGTWVGIVQLPVVENVLLGFEAIPDSGPAAVSELHTLTELGVDRAVLGIDRPASSFGEDDGEPLVSAEGRRWGWLGLAAGAAALTLIAFWTIGSVRGRGEEDAEGAAAAEPVPDEIEGSEEDGDEVEGGDEVEDADEVEDGSTN